MRGRELLKSCFVPRNFTRDHLESFSVAEISLVASQSAKRKDDEAMVNQSEVCITRNTP